MLAMVTSSTEIERKFSVDADTPLPDLASAGLRGGPPVVHDLDATYLDTPELSLTANRITLRRRTGGTDAGWHLKLPGGGAARREVHAPLTEIGTDDLGAQVPVEFGTEIGSLVGDQPLRPVAILSTTRTEYEIRPDSGAGMALLCDDVVRATGIDPVSGQRFENTWREWEVELAEGEESLLDRIETELRAAGAGPAASASKLARAVAPVLQARAAG
ncbi:MAG: CYTH domain-containing protein [Actinomycetales bacterium]